MLQLIRNNIFLNLCNSLLSMTSRKGKMFKKPLINKKWGRPFHIWCPCRHFRTRFYLKLLRIRRHWDFDRIRRWKYTYRLVPELLSLLEEMKSFPCQLGEVLCFPVVLKAIEKKNKEKRSGRHLNIPERELLQLRTNSAVIRNVSCWLPRGSWQSWGPLCLLPEHLQLLCNLRMTLV